MLTSFIATPNSQSAMLRDLKGSVDAQVIEYALDDWSFLFKSHLTNENPSIDDYCHRQGESQLILVGEVLNLEALRAAALLYDSSALCANPAGVIYILLEHLGTSVVSLMEGPFTLVLSRGQGKVDFITSGVSLLPVHIVEHNFPWITSELKWLSPLGAQVFDFEHEDVVCQEAFRQDTYVPIRNVRKTKPYEVISLKNDSSDRYHLQSALASELSYSGDQMIGEPEANTLLQTLLIDTVAQCAQASRIALPLSGGLDSSIVTALTASLHSDITTLSIGSESINEFEYSRLMADSVGSHHQEIILREEDVLQGVVASIYHNEIFDGLSSEIQSSLFRLYQHCEGQYDAFVTGYGSDLLFGGVLSGDTKPADVNPLLWEQVYRTRWTGELSPFGAQHHGLKVYHPFWNARLMAFCLNLNPALKVDGDVKVILKTFAKNHNLLPDRIIQRKKTGIHEGSFVNAIFAKALDTDTQDYQKKTRFSYRVYKQFLQDHQTPKTINLDKIIALFKAE